MSTLHLKIVTPEKLIYDDEVDQVNAPTLEGEVGILPHHANLMSRLTPGELTIKKSGKTSHLASGGGFLQMEGNVLTVMTDLAVEDKDIDEKAIEQAKKRAQESLEQKQTDEEYATTLAMIEKLTAQLRVKRRHRSRV